MCRLAASRETVSASAVAQIAFSGMAYAFCYVAAAFQYRHVMHTQTGTAESGHKGLQHAAAINNMVLIAVITVVSLLPVVRHKTPYSGTIQSSVISLQITVISYIATGTVVDTLVAIASLILEFGVLYHICTRSRTKSPLLMVQVCVDAGYVSCVVTMFICWTRCRTMLKTPTTDTLADMQQCASQMANRWAIAVPFSTCSLPRHQCSFLARLRWRPTRQSRREQRGSLLHQHWRLLLFMCGRLSILPCRGS